MNIPPFPAQQRARRLRRPFEVGFWVGLVLLNAVFNSITVRIDLSRVHAGTLAWEPWVWEFSSGIALLALVPVVIALERRWPFSMPTWRRSLPVHLVASVGYCLAHVIAMVLMRKAVYASQGLHYDFGNGPVQLGYEYLKDVRTYFLVIATVCLYRYWVMRMQGEARLLAEPDVGAPVDPVERPERFLVRKLGKEFLVAAREIEWLQASGNYVNLHVRGRDYPLRTTMAAIESRLDPSRFVRVHRAYYVNLDYLLEIEPLDTGDARLRLRDGTQVACSRRYRTALRERFSEPASA